MDPSRPLMTALFPDRDSAERGHAALAERGYTEADADPAIADLAALREWPIPEEKMTRYAAGVRQGSVLVGVQPRNDDDADFFHRHWTRHQAQEVHRAEALGAHPVGAGLGALAGAAAAGAAVGFAAGPIGTVIGAVAGAIGGGIAGRGVAEAVDPTAAGADPSA